MWKRLNNQRGARQPAISSPVLNETTLDENAYGGSLGLDINRAQSPPDRGQPPSRPLPDNMPQGLPRLPFEPIAPPIPQHTSSNLRTVSPVYSEPSLDPIQTRFHGSSYPNTTSYDDDVSPPSSPDIGAVMKSSPGQADDDEVSPIDEIPDMSRLGHGRLSSRAEHSRPPSSSIPVLRREKRRNQVAQAAANLVTRKEVGGNVSRERRTADTRWDPYSGEQTNSEEGKPSSAIPGKFTQPGLRSVHGPTGMELGNQSSVTAASKVPKSFGERVRNLKVNTSTERPEWKGASGRAAVVSPVADQSHVPPLNIPRKSSKRVTSALSASPSPVSVIRIGGGGGSGGGGTSPASAQMSEQIDSAIQSVLSHSGRNSPRLLNSPLSAHPLEPVLRATSANAPFAHGHKKENSAGSIERNFREAFKDVSFPGHNSEEPYVQPPSRFSVTTYAPSEVYSTPRLSMDGFDQPPPMPTPPQTYTTAQQPTPIVNRKRPKVAESPKATARKAVAALSPVHISMTSSIASKRASSITKALPQSPAEAESHDLVSSLQAQLDDLAHRKNNIGRSIRQMTQLMPNDGVLITDEVRRKRELEKMRVEGLREEEADVRRQEHDIGLRLHRAWKRRDKDATYEPTGLWVRRVTG